MAKLYCILLLFFLPVLVWSQEEAAESVLFIGNSYTYFWNLPQQVAAMAASRNVPLHTRQSTSGGTNLGQHWRGERELTSVELVRTDTFDVIILQDHSRRAFDAPDSLLYYCQRFAGAMDRSSARLYLYMTWAREWDPYMQPTITKVYTEAAKALDATLVPVGPAWMRARELRPGLPLYDPDQSHPSPMGTYLTACVFYGVLTGQSPVGLPHRLLSEDADGEKLYLNIQSEEDALFCQKVAADILGLATK